MENLQNKTVIVVGGSSGIGFGVALASLQSLARVVIIASSSAERVSEAVERLKAHNLPGEIRGEVLDAKDTVAIKQFGARLGTVDHVVWTSGDVPNFTDPQSMMTNVFSVRFWGPFILAQSVEFSPGGSLTLTGGHVDFKPTKGFAIQSGTSGAIYGITKGLAVDLAPVRVNLVSAGAIETEIWDKFPPEINTIKKQLSEQTLIKRFGTTSEIAEAYLFLMKCQYITGQRINVNGGIALT